VISDPLFQEFPATILARSNSRHSIFTMLHETFLVAACATFVLCSSTYAAVIPCPLDSLLEAPANWQMTPKAFAEKFTNGKSPHFVWLTKDHTRAKMGRRLYGDVTLNLTLFGGEVPVEEVIVDFAGGRLNLVSFSIYNRGDNGTITGEDFTARFTLTGKAMANLLAVKPRRKDADPQSGLITAGYGWFSQANGMALLEHNEKAMDGGDREFLRLRVARPDAEGSLAASMSHSRGGSAVRLGDLPDNLVKRDNGDVFIGTIPMVDQGDKGYCVVASTQRAFEYYGIGADMHQIAQVTKADPNLGTNPILMAKALDAIDYRFKTRLDIIGLGGLGEFTEVEKEKGEYYIGKPVDERKFNKEIHSYIDSGLPLLWALTLGIAPETPQLTVQAGGGHMRLIIGYNDKTEEIIFTDSWGEGHEFKKMKISDAYKVSTGLFVLKPTVH
jgi:Peptidase_C39 like family